MQKILLLLFIILFPSVYTFASSSDARKVEKKLSEYNDVDFKYYFKSYCGDFKEKTKLSYIDRYYNILMSSGTDEEVYDFVSDCIIRNREKDNIYFNKIIEDNYSKLIRKYYRYFFINIVEGEEVDPEYYDAEKNALKIFYNQLNQEDIKTYCNYITRNEYIIYPRTYKRLNILREKINNEDMKKISLKLEKDMAKYAKNKEFDLQYTLKGEIEESGIKHVSTLENIRKYYKVDIKYSTVLKYTKMYYYNILTQNYPELAQSILKYMKLKEIANDADYNENISSYEITQFSMYYSGMEVHHEDADVTYAYKLKTPLKIKGIFTLSNTRDNDDYELNKGKPKTDFSAYDKSFELMGMYIKAKNFIYGNNRYANILSLSEDISGEVNYDAEITIKPGSKIILDRYPEVNILVIYVDEVKLNKIISRIEDEESDY